MTEKLRADVRVQIVLEVRGLGPWGDDCTIAQVRRQAREQAQARVATFIREDAPIGVSILKQGDVSVRIVEMEIGEAKR